jgi:hypothetical protein
MFKDEVVPPKRAQLPQKLANGNYSEFSKYILILYNQTLSKAEDMVLVSKI